MVTLTELKQTGPERFLARFDNGEEVRTTLNIVSDLSLFSGKTVSDEEFTEILDASSLSLCKQRALHIIGARPMSCKELRDRLKEKGESAENAERTVDWMTELRLLDDEQYAAMCVRHYAAKGYGSGRIQSELFRRGVPREYWADALQELPEQTDQIDRLLQKKLRMEHPDRDDLRRAADYLYRRGFRRDEINAAIARWKDEIEVNDYGI